MKKHSKAIWLAVIAVIIATVVFCLSRTSLVEEVKRESARLFEYEYIPNQHVDLDSCAAASAADSIYKDFRKKYRFHYQTIGMASFADSSRMILLSELPPHFETDSIAPIFSQFTHKTEMRRHPIGYDGYVTDMVILLGNATQENCDRLIRQLNKELFFSEYKPTVMTLPVEHTRQYFAKESIDYQISLNEFYTWFIEEDEGFYRSGGQAENQTGGQIDTTRVVTVSDMFANRARGIFFSRLPGFVAWAVAKNEDIAGQVGDIRQFTLDADLILGALADSSTLVIIGRERQSPLYELPPLQIESILLLAATTEKELSQSLDINDLMAGKMNNGKDWCPTYLSKELENTEFGDLMTITDVLLKDWSEHGTIQEGYYRYPEPGYYPFDKPLFRKLGLNELVYNWNTAGAMYAIDCEKSDTSNTRALNYTIYTLGRTGSLPVSYFNSQERSESIGYRYESQAYHYFATLGNTDLARVVQYTALYQLFIDNNIRYSGNTYPSFPKNKPFLLYKPTKELLGTLRQLNGDEVARLADSLSQRSFRNYLKEDIDKHLRENEQNYHLTYSEENINHIYQNVHRDTKAGISGSIQDVQHMLNGLSEEQFSKLARFLSYPRGVKINDHESYHTLLRARKVNQLMREMGKNNLDLLGMDLKDVKNWFAANLSGNAGRYMKTSSLIITYNDLLTTGGHNLSSRISRVNRMTNYKRNRGNYTPTDYGQPTPTAPEISHDSPTDTKPTGHSPATAKPAGKSAPRASSSPTHSTQKKSTPASSQAPKPSSKTNIRPRSAVISSSPRTRRGL